MILKAMPVGPLMANCFIIGCNETLKAAVIDPGGDAEMILNTLDELNLQAEYILNTHGHFDHTSGNRQLKENTGAQLMIHKMDAGLLQELSATAASFGVPSDNSPPPDSFLEENDNIRVGNISLEVIHTPGHTPGGVTFHADGKLFAGDTLFAGSIGRTDFRGGDFETLKNSIQKKLFAYPDNTTVYSGHGPETTIGEEKRYNPFVRL